MCEARQVRIESPRSFFTKLDCTMCSTPPCEKTTEIHYRIAGNFVGKLTSMKFLRRRGLPECRNAVQPQD